MNRYPDMGETLCTRRFGAPGSPTEPARLGAPARSPCSTTCCTRPAPTGDEVVYAWRSFEAYPIAVAVAGATVGPGAGDADARHDLPAMLAAITDRTSVVLVCTPNNPTGPGGDAPSSRLPRQVPRTCSSSSTRLTASSSAIDDAVDRLATCSGPPNVVTHPHLRQGLRAGRPSGSATPSRFPRSPARCGRCSSRNPGAASPPTAQSDCRRRNRNAPARNRGAHPATAQKASDQGKKEDNSEAMKIESVDFFYVSMPEVTTDADGSQDALVVRVEAGGLVGWGECEASPLPSIAAFVTPMSHGGCRPVSASVLGQTIEAPQDIERMAAKLAYDSQDLLQARPHLVRHRDGALGCARESPRRAGLPPARLPRGVPEAALCLAAFRRHAGGDAAGRKEIARQTAFAPPSSAGGRSAAARVKVG